VSAIEITGRIFDGTSEEIEEGTVVINPDTGRIEEIRRHPVKTTSSHVEARGSITTQGTILPGLIDAHLHFLGGRKFNLLEWTSLPPAQAALRCVKDLRRLLEAGFTTVRDLGSRAGPYLRRAIEEGDLEGPRLLTSGRSLAETGGDDDPVDLPLDVVERLSYSIYCDGPWAARKAVREVVRDGANVIKLYASGSMVQGAEIRPALSSEEIAAIVAEAHKLGLKVAAHAYGPEPIRLAVEAGVDSIEHGIGLTEDICELMRQRGVFYVPTLSVYHQLRATATGQRAE
jgi:imidazolonepropionase-like amidohydrolase